MSGAAERIGLRRSICRAWLLAAVRGMGGMRDRMGKPGANALTSLMFAVSVATSVGLIASPAASAATIQPTTLDDDSSANGNCTLREAVQAANIDSSVDSCPAGSGADRIELLRGKHTLSVAGAEEENAQSGDLDIWGEVTIAGDRGGSVVDGGGIDRVFDIHSGRATLETLMITGGDASATDGGDLPLVPEPVNLNGGGLLVRGGHARLYRSTVALNTALSGGGIQVAGGELSIDTSTVALNQALEEGTQIDAQAGSLEIVMSTLIYSGDLNENSSVRIGEAVVSLKGTLFWGKCSGTLTSLGYNLFDELGSGPGCVITGQGSNITNGFAGVSGLSDNGGPTATADLKLGSFAFASGPPATDPVCSGVDQRGVPRPERPGRRCDIGAFEALDLHPDCEVGRFIFLGTDLADTLTGTEETDLLMGQPGRDNLAGLAGDDCLEGLDGRDRLRGGDGDDVLVGWRNFDRLSGQGGRDELFGGSGGGRLRGGPGNDYLLDGYWNEDTIPVPVKGNAIISGGAGNDEIDGSEGRDQLFGGSGDDELEGGEGRDRVDCGPGRDVVIAYGKDTVSPDCEVVKKRS